jgi:hypothetical protein
MQSMVVACSMVIAEKEIDIHTWREFRRAAKSAFTGIESAAYCAAGDVQKRSVDRFSRVGSLISRFLDRLAGMLLA